MDLRSVTPRLVILCVAALILPLAVTVETAQTVTLTGLSIQGPSSVTVGQTAQYTARATYSNGSSYLLTSGTSWSTSNSSVATITQLGGLLTAVGGGTVTVQAFYGGRSAQLGVSVAASAAPPPSSTVTLTGLSIQGPSSVTVGQTAQYTATATYSNGSSYLLTSGTSWSTSNSSVATITQLGGLLTAVGGGTVTVQAIYGGRSAQLGVSVAASAAPPPSSTVTLTGLSIQGPSSVTVGQTAQYTATATYSNGSSYLLTSGASWSTSNSSVATITQLGGLLTAVSAGTVTVQAFYGGRSAQLGVSVATSGAAAPPPPPPSPSGVGPQSTITCPSGAVDIWPGTNIQNVVNSYGASTSFCLRTGTHSINYSITPKSGDVFVGQYGAVLDGSGWSTSDDTQAAFRAHNQDIDYVTIRNLVIRNMPQRGIHAYYYLSDHWTVEYNEIASSKNAGIVFPPYSTIRNNYIHHNSYGGYQAPYAHYSVVDSNEIAYNGTEQKIAASTDVTFRNNFVHHNVANGIWYDWDNTNGLIEGNRVEDNGRIGINYEISRAGIIRNNIIRRSADAGVFLGTSRDTQIYNNTLDNNFRGITYFLDCPSLGGTLNADLVNNASHDNTITVGTQSGAFASLFSYASCTTTQVSPYVNLSKNLTFSHNTYHVPLPTTGRYWLWNGATVPVKYWNEWQAIPQDVTGTVSQ